MLSYWVDGRQALGHCSSSGFACSGGDRKNEQYGLRPHVLIRLQLLLSLWSLRRGWKQQRQRWRPKAKAAKLRAAGDGDYCRPALIKWMMGAGCSPQKGSFASKMGCHGMPLYESTRTTLNQADASHKPTPSHSRSESMQTPGKRVAFVNPEFSISDSMLFLAKKSKPATNQF